MNDRSDYQLNKCVDVALSISHRASNIHQLAKRIDIEVKRKRILKLANVNRSLEINELKAKDNFGDISRRETSSRELYKRWILDTPLKVSPEESALNTNRARRTRHIKNNVSLSGEALNHISSNWSLPEMRIRKRGLEGVPVARITSRVDIDLL
jgi:hypothetical protein